MAPESSNTGTWQQRLMFALMYRTKNTPWDGHVLPDVLQRIGAESEKGRVLDVGCGTGDATIFLAQHGWDVTAVDFVQAALDRARAKANAAGAKARFVRADATRLRASGVAGAFDLIVDQGMLHGLSDAGRVAYVREVTAITAPGARMIVGAFPRGERQGPRGIDREEIDALFRSSWTLMGTGPEPRVSARPEDPIMMHELKRQG